MNDRFLSVREMRELGIEYFINIQKEFAYGNSVYCKEWFETYLKNKDKDYFEKIIIALDNKEKCNLLGNLNVLNTFLRIGSTGTENADIIAQEFKFVNILIRLLKKALRTPEEILRDQKSHGCSAEMKKWLKEQGYEWEECLKENMDEM